MEACASASGLSVNAVVASTCERGMALHVLVISCCTVKQPTAPYMSTAISMAVGMWFSLTSEGREEFLIVHVREG
jgi:hypothetical protein